MNLRTVILSGATLVGAGLFLSGCTNPLTQRSQQTTTMTNTTEMTDSADEAPLLTPPSSSTEIQDIQSDLDNVSILNENFSDL